MLSRVIIDCDVLIVGAGPAGTAAGVTLARAGARVTIVDRATFPRPKTCGDALSNAAVALLRSIAGAEAEALPRAEVRSATAVLPSGARITRRFGDEPGWIVPRVDLDACLRRAAESAGAAVIEGVRVTSLVREGAAIVGALAGGRGWRSRVVLAADGPGSVAGPALGLERPTPGELAVAATCYVEGARLGDPSCSEHYFDRELPCGYGWVFPAVAGRSNVGVYQRADAYRSGGVHLHELLDGFMARHPEVFGEARVASPIRSWPLPLRRTPLAAAGRPGLLLLGDAARLVDPLSGEGIWQALRSGVIAGQVAARALRAGGQVGWAEVGRHRLRLAVEIGGASWLKGQIQGAMRVIVARGLDRRPSVVRALQWGYGRGVGEVSKRVGAAP